MNNPTVVCNITILPTTKPPRKLRVLKKNTLRCNVCGSKHIGIVEDELTCLACGNTYGSGFDVAGWKYRADPGLHPFFIGYNHE